MIRNYSHRGKRSAFTLVELTVVILIIAILVSLLSSAVLRALAKIPEVQTRTEIAEMTVALQAFMVDYNLAEPPPSYLVLYENVALYATSALPGAAQSYQFLRKVFGNNLGSQGYIGWSGQAPTGNGAWTLEGEQCLVFYLGGIPTAPGLGTFSPQGFSTNGMNPALVGGKRKGPYYTFQVDRLVSLTNYNPKASPFPVYIDPWQSKTSTKPYAFFSSYGINNGYTAGQCPSIGAAPYFTAPGQYTNSNTYQIISAGKDGAFGTVGWTPASGAVGAGADDQANFSGGLLGVGQQ